MPGSMGRGPGKPLWKEICSKRGGALCERKGQDCELSGKENLRRLRTMVTVEVKEVIAESNGDKHWHRKFDYDESIEENPEEE